MTLPNCIIGGTGRAGTTSLFRYLTDHPVVCGSSKKETRFFLDHHGDLDSNVIGEYENYFANCTPDKRIRLEATPHYLYGGPDVVETIRRTLPDLKIIFVLREPASRFISIYQGMRVSTPALQNCSFEEFLEIALSGKTGSGRVLSRLEVQQVQRCITYGRYVSYLSDYLGKFSPVDEVAVFFYEDLTKDVHAMMKRVCRFLHIDSSFYDGYRFRIENKGRHYRYPRLFRLVRSLNNVFEPVSNKYPSIRRYARSLHAYLNERRYDHAEISTSGNQRLMALFRKSNEQLLTLLYQNFPDICVPDWLRDYS